MQKYDGGSTPRDGNVQFHVGCYRDAVVGSRISGESAGSAVCLSGPVTTIDP